jgi:hypothetical protein
MPMFDFFCRNCGASFEMFVPCEHRDHVICNTCGCFTTREWRVGPSVIDDTVPGGFTIENLDKTPQTFYSKSDYRDAMRARGLMNFVRHIGKPGSDKNPGITDRWV